MQIESIVPRIKDYLLVLQNTLKTTLEAEEEGAKFLNDTWEYQQGGGGITSVLENGLVFEKGGVNFSHVYGLSLPEAATVKRPELQQSPFQALGVSVVMHPRNPHVPTAHLNVRFIVVETKQGLVWWFGGGFDLTPYYGYQDDAIHWHQMAKKACEPWGSNVYSRFKKQCDVYFYLKHRQEPRGIGGLFYDDLNEWGFESCFEFMQSVGHHFILAYQPLVAKRKSQAYGEKERAFQAYRRGRYVEFNLLYDRGTLFGLQSGGRTESILMSLPPVVNWKYDWMPEKNSPEEVLYREFLVAKEWV